MEQVFILTPMCLFPTSPDSSKTISRFQSLIEPALLADLISVSDGAGDWEHRNTDALKKVILEELGLELVPSREEIDMLVVENAN